MERVHLEMSNEAFLAINSPLTIVNLAGNIFFAWCLIFPPRDQPAPRQPLTMLLACIAICSVVYFAILPAMFYMEEYSKEKMFNILWTITLYMMHNSMNCYVWLNLLCYIHIVPTRRALWVWVRRNQRPLIQAVLLSEQAFFLFKSVVDTEEIKCTFADSSLNVTLLECMSRWTVFKTVSSYFFRGHIVTSLCVAGVSSLSTACYLYGHMRNMEKSNNASGKRRVRSQMRVTVTGIAQGVFYCTYGILYFLDSLSAVYFQMAVFSPWIILTIMTLYMTGTTLNLAMGQAVFRRRIVDTWTAMAALCAVAAVTLSGRPTSVEMADPVTVDVKVS